MSELERLRKALDVACAALEFVGDWKTLADIASILNPPEDHDSSVGKPW